MAKKEKAVIEVSINNEQHQKKLKEMISEWDDLNKHKKEALKTGDLDLHKAIEKEMRGVKREINQMQRQVIDVDDVLRNINKVPMKDIKNALRKLRREMDGIEQGSDKYLETQQKILKLEQQLSTARSSKGGLSKLGGALAVFGGNLMTKALSGVKQLIDKGKEWINQGIKMSAKAEGIVTAFNKLNEPNLLENLRRETKGTVNDLELMTAAVRAENFQIPLDKLGGLLKFAQQRAQETGESVDYLTKSIIDGIGRKSPLILDNLGISATRLREEMKKTGDFTAAASKIVEEELAKQGNLAITSADLATQSAVKWENAQLRVGKSFQGVSNWWNKLKGNIADAVSDIVGDSKTASEALDDHAQSIVNLEVNIRPLTERYDELMSKTNLNIDEHQELKSIMKEVGDTAPYLISQFGEYGETIALNTGLLDEYINTEKSLLAWKNKDLISDLDKEIGERQKEVEKIQRTLKSGVREGRKILADGTVEKDRKLLGSEIEALKKNLGEEQSMLKGVKTQRERYTGDYLEQLTRRGEAQRKFNGMNKEQLEEWIAGESKAIDDYQMLVRYDAIVDDQTVKKFKEREEALALAKQKLEQRFSNSGESKPAKSKTSWSPDKELDFIEQKLSLRKQLLSGELATEDEYATKLLALEISTYESRIAKGREKGEELLKLQASLSDKRYEQTKREETRLSGLLLASVEGSDKKVDLYTKEKLEHENRLKSLGLFNKNFTDLTIEQQNALTNLERNYASKLQKIYTDHLVKEAQKEEKEGKRRISAIKIKHNEEIQQLDTLDKKKEFIRQEYGAKAANAIRSERQADSQIRKYYDQIEQQELLEHLNKIKDNHIEILGELRNITDEGFSIGDLNPEDAERIQEMLDNVNEQLTSLREPAGGSDVDLMGKVDILGYTKSDWEIFFNNLDEGKLGIDGWRMALGLISNAVGQISSLMSALEQQEIKAFEKNQNKKKKDLDRQKKAGLISEQRYNDSIQQLDEETDQKREEMQRKQAIRDKALSIFQALVNTALGITAALSVQPGGIVLAAIVGAMGAAQVATILATPLPGAEEGGEIGVVREQDGKQYDAKYTPKKRGYINRTSVIVAENGAEYVIPNEGYQNPRVRQVIDVIERARQNGTLGTIDLPTEMLTTSMPGRAFGGYVGSSAPTSSNDSIPVKPTVVDSNYMPELVAVINELSATNRELREQLKDGVSVSMVGKNGFIGQAKKLLNIINNSRA